MSLVCFVSSFEIVPDFGSTIVEFLPNTGTTDFFQISGIATSTSQKNNNYLAQLSSNWLPSLQVIAMVTLTVLLFRMGRGQQVEATAHLPDTAASWRQLVSAHLKTLEEGQTPTHCCILILILI